VRLEDVGRLFGRPLFRPFLDCGVERFVVLDAGFVVFEAGSSISSGLSMASATRSKIFWFEADIVM